MASKASAAADAAVMPSDAVTLRLAPTSSDGKLLGRLQVGRELGGFRSAGNWEASGRQGTERLQLSAQFDSMQ